MKPLTTLIVCACAALALSGCGSSSDKPPAQSGAAAKAPTSAQAKAASDVCSARSDIQTQVKSLTSMTAASATTAGVSSALTAIAADLQKIKGAQPDLAPERKQQVKSAATAFGTQLKEIARQTVAGLSKHDAKTQAQTAAASLGAAVKASLQPIAC
jgi:type VI protein secretion system component VasK